MSVKRLANVLMISGLIVTAVALWWWQDFFRQVADTTGTSLTEFTECLYRSTLTCDVTGVAGSIFGLESYEPAVLWVGGSLFAVGLVLRFVSR